MSQLPSQSLLQRVIRKHGRQAVLDMLDADQRLALQFMWRIMARPAQLSPRGRWRWWLNRAGRGFGKTRSGSEWIREKARRMPGARGFIAGQTPEEVRDIQVEGPAGILACCPANEKPEWEPTKGELRFPNGCVIEVLSGANPEGPRGRQYSFGWIDELAKMPRHRAFFDNVNMGLRLEYHGGEEQDREPQCLITTTPRPIALLREIAKKPNCVVTTGSTYENRANLAPSFFEEMTTAYEGTRLGRQELHGEQLDDTPGALWQRAMFDRAGFRRRVGQDLREFEAIAVAIDPAVSNTESSDESGIIVAGMRFGEGSRKHFHVLRDASMYGTARERARTAILAYLEFEADCFVLETNNGGDWIPAVIEAEWADMQRDEMLRHRLAGRPKIVVVTATRGKHVRAEPIATLYEQHGVVTHEPELEVLEDQLVSWSPLLAEKSPDRLDALVWCLTYLSTLKRVVVT